MLSDDLTVVVCNCPPILSRKRATRIINKINVASITNRKSECLLTGRSRECICPKYHVRQGIHHIHLISVPTITIGVGKNDGDFALVFRHTQIRGEGDATGPVAELTAAAIGLHFHFVGGGKVESGQGVGILGDGSHSPIHFKIESGGCRRPAYRGGGATRVVDDEVSGLEAGGRLTIAEGSLGDEVALCSSHSIKACAAVALHASTSDIFTCEGTALVVTLYGLIHTYEQVSATVEIRCGELHQQSG